MSQLNATAYDIQRPSGVCAATGRELTPGETYYVVLVDPPEEERAATPPEDAPKKRPENPGTLSEPPLIRIDLSKESWESGFRPPHLFGYWRTLVPEPNEKKKLLVGNAAIQDLLINLAEVQEPKQLAFRYVLALILLRKKLLRHDGIDRREDPDGDGPVQDWWRFTTKLDINKGHFGKWNDDLTLQVLDPHIDAKQITGVTEQLGQVLELDL